MRRYRSTAALLSMVLAGAPTACGSSSSQNPGDPGHDSGVHPGDSGVQPGDSGTPPTDGSMPTDSTVTGNDTGMPGTDGGMVGSDTGGGIDSSGPPDTGSGHAIKTVFVIMEENRNWSSIKGGSAPYIDNTLLPAAAHAENYKTPPGNHPSEPNYLWLEGGTNFNVTDDNEPATNHLSSTAHLVTQMKNAGVTWKAYVDSAPTACPLMSSGAFAAKHTPMLFFDDVTNNLHPDAYCKSHIVDYSQLAADISANAVAQYNFITPNLNNDMHDGSIAAGDSWLHANVPMIQASSAYTNGGVIFIIWDEGANGSDGPMGMIVLSSLAKGGYSSSMPYTHSSTLRTVQEIFNLTPLLGDAANATDLKEFFTTFP